MQTFKGLKAKAKNLRYHSKAKDLNFGLKDCHAPDCQEVT